MSLGLAYLAVDRQTGSEVLIKECLPADLVGRKANSSLVYIRGDQENFDNILLNFLDVAESIKKEECGKNVKVLRVFRENNTAYFVLPYEGAQSSGRMMEEVDRRFFFLSKDRQKDTENRHADFCSRVWKVVVFELVEMGKRLPKYRNGQGDYYYYGGNKQPVDFYQAVTWYRKSAEQGDFFAHYSLGFCYESGRVCPKIVSRPCPCGERGRALGCSLPVEIRTML